MPISEQFLDALFDAVESLRRDISGASAGGSGSVQRMRRRWRVSLQAPRVGKERCWQLRYHPPKGEGKRHQRSSRTECEVEARALAEQEEARLNGGGASLATVSQRYLEHCEAAGDLAPVTVSGYRRKLALVGRHLTAPTREAVHQARDALLEEGYSSTYVRNCMGAAKAAWTWACDRGHVGEAWPRVKPLRARETKLRPPTQAELVAIFAAAREYQGGRYWPLVALIAETGCRCAEACSLRGADVDRERGAVYFERRWKSRTSRRMVPVSRELLKLLPEVEPGALLFVGVRSGRQISSASASGAFKRVLIHAELADHAHLGSLHCLRRAWVTAAQSAGVRPELSMRLAGHASLGVHASYARRAVNDASFRAAEQVRSAMPPLYGPYDDTPTESEDPTDSPPLPGGSGEQAENSKADTGVKWLKPKALKKISATLAGG